MDLIFHGVSSFVPTSFTYDLSYATVYDGNIEISLADAISNLKPKQPQLADNVQVDRNAVYQSLRNRNHNLSAGFRLP